MVSIKEARERHFEARKVLAACVDPMAERRAETEAKLSEIRAAQREPEMSIVKIAGAWWEWWAVGKSPRHADTVIRRLKADVFPALGHKFIEQLRLPTFGK